MTTTNKNINLFNGPLEIGLRALTILTEAFPLEFSLQQLVAFDYLLVHSDDIMNGPTGLHPKTPHRSGEFLVRRKTLSRGLRLFMSRRLIVQHYRQMGLYYSATDYSGSFLDSLTSDYTINLRKRAEWVVTSFNEMSESELDGFMLKYFDKWDAEFELESALWKEELV